MKSNQHIEIVRSGIRGMNYMSTPSCESIAAVLTRHYTQVNITVIYDSADLDKLADRKPDLVFLGAECVPSSAVLGADDSDMRWIAHYLDAAGIAYTGSSHAAHRLGRDKALAKQRVLDAGLMTSAYCVLQRGQPLPAKLPGAYPLFVKPTSRGGGLGVDSNSVVRNNSQLRAKTSSIVGNLQSDALVEVYLAGREFSVALLRRAPGKHYAMMPLELIAPPDDQGVRILSNGVKSSNSERAIKVNDEAVRSKVNILALKSFEALGARDYGRIDIRMDAQGVPHFLEANLMPSLISGYGSFPKACVLNAGLDYESMILRITTLGLSRSESVVEHDAATGDVYTSLDATLEPV